MSEAGASPATGRGILDFGDIVLVPFPFTDQTATKRRPAVIVSSRAYNSERPDLIMMAVTSQLRPALTGMGWGEVWVTNWQAAGLLKPSAIKPVVATLEQGLIIRTLGRLSSEDQDELHKAIGQIIG